jgi:hypothetical protein
MSMAVADWSGQAWLQGFNEAGLVVFGKTADEIHEIKASIDVIHPFLGVYDLHLGKQRSRVQRSHGTGHWRHVQLQLSCQAGHV